MTSDERDIADLVKRFGSRAMSRRELLAAAAAGAIGAGGVASLLVGATVDEARAVTAATPVATPSGGSASATPGPGMPRQLLMTREQVGQAVFATYPRAVSPSRGGQVVSGYPSDITTTNPIIADNSPTLPVLGLVFESLLRTSPIDGAYIPGLADSCESSADGLTLTYSLHPDVRWHDGQPLTTADVKLSLDARANPDTGSAYTGDFLQTVASYTVLDDHTFTVTLNRPFAAVIAFGKSDCPIIPAHIWQDIPFAEWAADPGSTGEDPSRVIGTGPFSFQEWRQGERVIVNRNDAYWDDIPNIDQFIYRMYPDDAATVEAMLAGEIDTYDGVAAAEASTVAGAGLDVTALDTSAFTFFAYNLDQTKTALFQDRDVRQALFYGLDRQSIVDNILLGAGTVARGTQPVLSVAYRPDQITTTYDYDPHLARKLLDAAGWAVGPDGLRQKDGDRLAFEVIYASGSAISDQLLAYMQDAWRHIGVDMTPNPVDFATVLVPTLTGTHNYQVAMLGFSWDYSGDQSAMFATSSYGQSGFNVMKYSNERYDRIAEQAMVEQDARRRIELLVQATNIVNDDLPVGILNFAKDLFVINDRRVKNYAISAFAGSDFGLQYCTIDEHVTSRGTSLGGPDQASES